MRRQHTLSKARKTNNHCVSHIHTKQIAVYRTMLADRWTTTVIRCGLPYYCIYPSDRKSSEAQQELRHAHCNASSSWRGGWFIVQSASMSLHACDPRRQNIYEVPCLQRVGRQIVQFVRFALFKLHVFVTAIIQDTMSSNVVIIELRHHGPAGLPKCLSRDTVRPGQPANSQDSRKEISKRYIVLLGTSHLLPGKLNKKRNPSSPLRAAVFCAHCIRAHKTAPRGLML